MDKFVRANLTDQIFDYMKKQIMDGTWQPGEKIPSETELSQELQVSRMSLRSAIRKSNVLGLTETRVGEGTFVKKFDMRSYLKELYGAGLLTLEPNKLNDMRYLLQMGSIQFAMENDRVDEYLPKLKECTAKMVDSACAGDKEAFHQADMEFHRTICSLSQNDLLYMVYDAIESMLDELITENVNQSVKHYGGYKMVVGHHQDIVEGLEKHDINKCREALEASRRRSYTYYATTKEKAES